MMQQPKTPAMTEEALIAFLETQDPNAEYTFQDPAGCLMARYFAAHDAPWSGTAYHAMPNYLAIAGDKPHTFGAALERARALKALPAPAPTLELTATKSELLPAAA